MPGVQRVLGVLGVGGVIRVIGVAEVVRAQRVVKAGEAIGVKVAILSVIIAFISPTTLPLSESPTELPSWEQPTFPEVTWVNPPVLGHPLLPEVATLVLALAAVYLVSEDIIHQELTHPSHPITVLLEEVFTET